MQFAYLSGLLTRVARRDATLYVMTSDRIYVDGQGNLWTKAPPKRLLSICIRSRIYCWLFVSIKIQIEINITNFISYGRNEVYRAF